MGAWGLASAPSASAQVCGDANGDGSVNVTDGVQVLRAAAGLPSTCTQNANECNVDGAGDVTVTDGVNVLRKAANLTITENCPGGTEGDVTDVTDRVVPFLTLGLQEVPGLSIPGSVSGAGGTEDCEDGGTRSTTQTGASIQVNFTDCQVSDPDLGRVELDGFIRVSISFNVLFELNVTDLDSGRLVDFDGQVQGRPRDGGGFVIDGGPVSVSDSEGGVTVLTLTFDDFAIDDDGSIVSGSVQAEDTSDSFELQTVEIEVEDGNTTAAELRVVRDDQSEELFLINLETGDITPAN